MARNGRWLAVALTGLLMTASVGCGSSASNGASGGNSIELLNVSYDPTRELWKDVNQVFAKQHAAKTGQRVHIKQSHGGSGSQARAVIDGLEADVVTLALWGDVDAIRKSGLISDGWEQKLPNDSHPYFSTIVFVVRQGNPKGIKDWPDLARDDIQIITPSPKTSGNGKLSLLAAWGSVVTRGGSEADAEKFVAAVYQRAPVLDSGARQATTTFAQRGIGDVHLTWENEAHLEVAEAAGELEIVYPPVSVLAEPPVAVVEKNAENRGTGDAARAYLEFLYTPEGQAIIARHHYRPSDADILQAQRDQFPDIKLFTVEEIAGGWTAAQDRFFADGALFDRIYAAQVK